VTNPELPEQPAASQPPAAVEPPPALTPAPVTPSAAPVWPTPGGPSVDAGAVPAAPAAYPTRTSGNAVAALILSILSWVICPIVLAIIALVLAAKADREVAASNGTVTASGLALTAKVVAWVNIGVSAAGIVIGIIVLLIALAAGGFAAIA
jgi:hypothetical protein